MIAELFYPKELKQTIADLRAKGDLNEAALKEINQNVWFSFICSGVVTAIVLVKNSLLITFIFFICFGLLGSFISLRRAIYMFSLPYTKGKIHKGVIKSVRFGKDYYPRAPKGWRIDYSFVDDEGQELNGSSDVIFKAHVGSDIPKKGEEIQVYVHPNDTSKHGIFLPYYFKRYCLSKSHIEQTL